MPGLEKLFEFVLVGKEDEGFGCFHVRILGGAPGNPFKTGAPLMSLFGKPGIGFVDLGEKIAAIVAERPALPGFAFAVKKLVGEE